MNYVKQAGFQSCIKRSFIKKKGLKSLLIVVKLSPSVGLESRSVFTSFCDEDPPPASGPGIYLKTTNSSPSM